MRLFKTNKTKDYSKPTHIRNVYGGGKNPRKLKKQKQSEENIIKNIRKISKDLKRKLSNQLSTAEPF